MIKTIHEQITVLRMRTPGEGPPVKVSHVSGGSRSLFGKVAKGGVAETLFIFHIERGATQNHKVAKGVCHKWGDLVFVPQVYTWLA